MVTRNPNASCSICKSAIYRRPRDIERSKFNFCSRECQTKWQLHQSVEKECPGCGVTFAVSPKRAERRKYCSPSCSNKSRRGIRYKIGGEAGLNKHEARRAILIDASGIKHCMVKGCCYGRALDIHRLIPGKDGGEYVLGNMFLLCPNHHAEIHRHAIEVKKSGDFELKITIDFGGLESKG